jgi:hypothetical protein
MPPVVGSSNSHTSVLYSSSHVVHSIVGSTHFSVLSQDISVLFDHDENSSCLDDPNFLFPVWLGRSFQLW